MSTSPRRPVNSVSSNRMAVVAPRYVVGVLVIVFGVSVVVGVMLPAEQVTAVASVIIAILTVALVIDRYRSR